jgi:hypothetical protein
MGWWVVGEKMHWAVVSLAGVGRQEPNEPRHGTLE